MNIIASSTSTGIGRAYAMHTPEIRSLTGLRFCAAFCILFAHMNDWLFRFSDSTVSRYLATLSLYGMPLFFVLSGFVIHLGYGKVFSTKPYGRAVFEFATARFARLYPLYFVLLVFAASAEGLLTMVHGDLAKFGYIILRFLTLTQSWSYSLIEGRMLLNWAFALSWSISTEVFFYIVYALGLYRISGLNSARASATLLLGYTLIALLVCAWCAHDVQFNSEFANSFDRWQIYFSPYARIWEFILGALTAQFYVSIGNLPSHRESVIGKIVQVIALAMLLGLGFAWLDMSPDRPTMTKYVSFMLLNFGLAPPLAALIFCAARYRSWLSRFLSFNTLHDLGERSYSIYLLQFWIVRFFAGGPVLLTTVTAIDGIVRVCLGGAATILIALATYRWIELPAKNWIRVRAP